MEIEELKNDIKLYCGREYIFLAKKLLKEFKENDKFLGNFNSDDIENIKNRFINKKCFGRDIGYKGNDYQLEYKINKTIEGLIEYLNE